jgi:hypothetical protein
MGETFSSACSGEPEERKDKGSKLQWKFGEGGGNERRGSGRRNSGNGYFKTSMTKFASPDEKSGARVDYGATIKARAAKAKKAYQVEQARNVNGKLHEKLKAAHRKYVAKLRELQHLASTNFQFTIAQQLELEVEAAGKYGEAVSVDLPLEVPAGPGYVLSMGALSSSAADRREEVPFTGYENGEQGRGNGGDSNVVVSVPLESPEEAGDNIFYNEDIAGFGRPAPYGETETNKGEDPLEDLFKDKPAKHAGADEPAATSDKGGAEKRTANIVDRTTESASTVEATTPTPTVPLTFEEERNKNWNNEFSARIKEKAQTKSKLQLLLMKNAISKTGNNNQR